MNLHEIIFKDIQNTLSSLGVEHNVNIQDIGEFIVEFPKEGAHGDLSTNVLMVIKKHFKTKIEDLSDYFITALLHKNYIYSVDFANPGFLNIFIKIEFWWKFLQNINHDHIDYAKVDLKEYIGKDEVINIEYVSANPTGPFTYWSW